MEGIEFLRFVWGRQDGMGLVSFAIKDHETHWDERVLGAENAIPSFGEYATYFCPNTFQHRRKKEQCLPGRWLWQDLDEVTPDECAASGYPPSLWWETSPDRYQALWALRNEVPPQELAMMNKALNRTLNADKGTWNLTRLLRVPGSYNGKRDCMVSAAYEYAAATA